MKKFYFSLFLLFTFVLTAKIFGIKFNYTYSMPIGFYKSVKAKTIHCGDLVAVCLPKRIAVEGLKRHYLKSGSCPSGVVPVLKKVIAVPGDRVNLSKQFVTVNYVMYRAPSQLKDHLNKTVKHFVKNGSYATSKPIGCMVRMILFVRGVRGITVG